MADSSFDVVSRVDHQEVDNALNQAAREVATRFDFKGTSTTIAWSKDAIEIRANTPERARAAYEVFAEKLVRRGVSLKAVRAGEPVPAAGGTVRMELTLAAGIDADLARRLHRLIRAEAPKGVTSTTQGDQLRVTGKKRDDLQATIALLRAAEVDVPLQFVNFR